MELPIMNNLTLSDQEYNAFVELIYKICGINLGDNKKELVKARLMKRIRFYQFSTFRQYYDYVLSDNSGRELEDLLNAISTNVTNFFREKQHFDLMANVCLPDIIARKKDHKIRIWSAASSSGEEIYTILMTIMENMKDASSWDIKVLVTDISTKALAAAKQGAYNLDKVKDIPAHLLNKYFDKIRTGNGFDFVVKPFLKSMAYFARLNLMNDTFPFQGKFDIIFCRNVMIYFDKETQGILINKLYNYLEDEGYLFIGHSESLVGLHTEFRTIAAAAFKKTAAQAGLHAMHK